MLHIRPYELFALVKSSPAERIVQMQIPARRTGGSLTLLETCVLLAATQVVDAKRIFEVGTFLGSTTLNLALNTPSDGRVWTLDLDGDCLSEVTQHPADREFTARHFDAPTLDFVGSSVESKISTLTGNSQSFDFSWWKDSIDLVFIDGGHDLETVRSDTENAFRMLSKKSPACVVWHDYGNPDYPELTSYFDDLCAEDALLHIEETMLCLSFSGS
jgi:predicted O-methyltransferase YrrM